MLASIVLWAALTAAQNAPQTYSSTPTNTSKCSCYVTGGNTPALYLNHRFFDFRKLDTSTDNYDTTTSPPLVKGDSGTESAPNAFLTDSAFASDWNLQQWSKDPNGDSTVKLVNSPANCYISTPASGSSNQNTHLTFRTHRFLDFQSTAEAESATKDFLHASFRYRARVRGDAGAVAGLFTFYDDNNESDIEILTRDPKDVIRYSNQPQVDSSGNYVQASETDQTLPAGMAWDGWNTHRMDWLAEMVSWSINGVNVVNKTYSVPARPLTLTLNMWSDGGTWSGVMKKGNEAFLDLGWIQMVYNTSDAGERKRTCDTVCAIDTGKDAADPVADPSTAVPSASSSSSSTSSTGTGTATSTGAGTATSSAAGFGGTATGTGTGTSTSLAVAGRQLPSLTEILLGSFVACWFL